jgi:hypothetical protein
MCCSSWSRSGAGATVPFVLLSVVDMAFLPGTGRRLGIALVRFAMVMPNQIT